MSVSSVHPVADAITHSRPPWPLSTCRTEETCSDQTRLLVSCKSGTKSCSSLLLSMFYVFSKWLGTQRKRLWNRCMPAQRHRSTDTSEKVLGLSPCKPQAGCTCSKVVWQSSICIHCYCALLSHTRITRKFLNPDLTGCSGVGWCHSPAPLSFHDTTTVNVTLDWSLQALAIRNW